MRPNHLLQSKFFFSFFALVGDSIEWFLVHLLTQKYSFGWLLVASSVGFSQAFCQASIPNKLFALPSFFTECIFVLLQQRIESAKRGPRVGPIFYKLDLETKWMCWVQSEVPCQNFSLLDSSKKVLGWALFLKSWFSRLTITLCVCRFSLRSYAKFQPSRSFPFDPINLLKLWLQNA